MDRADVLVSVSVLHSAPNLGPPTKQPALPHIVIPPPVASGHLNMQSGVTDKEKSTYVVGQFCSG